MLTRPELAARYLDFCAPETDAQSAGTMMEHRQHGRKNVEHVKVVRAADRSPEQVQHLHQVGAREIKRHAGLMKMLAK